MNDDYTTYGDYIKDHEEPKKDFPSDYVNYLQNHALSLENYKTPYTYEEWLTLKTVRTPVGTLRPEPYKVKRIFSEESMHVLNQKLEVKLNEMAEDNYHPIKVDFYTDLNPYYIVIFYYMPNGPAFTPPF